MADNESVDVSQAIRDVIAQVMEIEGVTLDDHLATVRAFGKLTMPSDEAFALLQTNLAEHGHTPLMYREQDQDHVLAVESEVIAPSRPLWWLAIPLFLGTLVRLAQLGILQDTADPIASLGDYFSHWTLALPYAGAIMGTLVVREVARFLIARRNGQKITLPFFLPLPGLLNLLLPVLMVLGNFGGFIFNVALIFQMGWGTMGSFAVQRTPVRDRRVAFDMAVAATLAGLVVAVTVLVIGLLGSDVLTPAGISQLFPPGTLILQEGNSLLYRGVKLAIFGKWLPNAQTGEDVLISTLANAGWAAVLVTMFHLLPFGSLDGGSIAFGLFGHRAAWLRWVVVVALLGLTLFYPGWLLWLAFILIFRRSQVQVLDEITPLGRGRKVVGLVMLLLLILLFVPVPSRTIAVIAG